MNATANKPRRGWGRWVGRFATILVLCLLLAWGLCTWMLHRWEAKPPPLPADTSILALKPVPRGDRVYYGACWAGWREGLHVLYLKGTPFEMGYAAGVLLQDQMNTLENEFISMVHGWVPEEWKLRLLKSYITYNNRHLSEYVPLDFRLELLGASMGCPDKHPEIGPYYHRVLNYHAAQDVSYLLIDNPLVSKAGCTSFGAWGTATIGGHLLTGRNFDWEAAEVFGRDRVVVMAEPAGGIPFVSLAWAGMFGVVSGMNRAGVSVTINGAPSNLPKDIGTPVAIIARDILEHTHNLSEALDRLKRARVFVSTIWLLGSRADGKFVVVEKTPSTTHVREPAVDWLVCANHFQSPGLAEDDRNTNYMAEATSLPRAQRLIELIQDRSSPLDAAAAAAILRDRRLPGGAFPGNGHRGTINALIATHATIMDLTDGIFWAAAPPHQLGKFVAFDTANFEQELSDRTVPADPILVSGEFERARKSRDLVDQGRKALRAGDGQAAVDLAAQAEKLNPGFYQNAELQGRALLELHQHDAATAAIKKALQEKPAFLPETKELEALATKAATPSAR